MRMYANSATSASAAHTRTNSSMPNTQPSPLTSAHTSEGSIVCRKIFRQRSYCPAPKFWLEKVTAACPKATTGK